MTRTPEASTERGTGPAAVCADRATSCQEVSPGAGVAGPLGSARYAPAPGRVTTTPSAASWASARETVTGLTRYRSTSLLLDGRRSPGE